MKCKVEELLNIYGTLNYSNPKFSSSNAILLLLLLATGVLLYSLTLQLFGVCALSIHQKEMKMLECASYIRCALSIKIR
jgi:hypothetical protein